MLANTLTIMPIYIYIYICVCVCRLCNICTYIYWNNIFPYVKALSLILSAKYCNI